MTGQQNDGPTVRRLQLGARLRSLRLAKGVTRDRAGYEIRASESKISRMELGRVSFKERDVTDLLKLYGVDDEGEHERLLTLAREANTPGWWHSYGDVLSSWFQNYLDLEQAAELIRTYEIQFVPGLLQTDAYARAVIMLGHGSATPAEIGRRAELRMARKQMLADDDQPRLWAVLDEAVLRRPRPVAPSASCASRTRTCPTWSTSSTSPAGSTSTSPRRWTTTPRRWAG
ncbi:transcriptional regulator with XRE-family HTH domain [Actinoplanes digitatis]|uniref:Transcriptional regulator with XRE-family HTH domain n=1 Tax=Actinoplanes digitatis TaxID=1868 RepID=A0A7W7HXX0_9ACTN|nr:transcriptional regulator with XRE-family HTH domain [Actinoplanes digitatis]